MVARILAQAEGAIDLAGQLVAQGDGGPERPGKAVRRRGLGADAHRGGHGHADWWPCFGHLRRTGMGTLAGAALGSS